MGAGRGATVGVVTELVDVEGTLSVGVVAGDVPGDGGGAALGSLLEGDGTSDLRVSAEDSNWFMLAHGSWLIVACFIYASRRRVGGSPVAPPVSALASREDLSPGELRAAPPGHR